MQIDMKRLESALRNAHSAGDRVAAKKLANAIKAQREVQPEASIGHKVGAVIDGLAQGLTLGFSDEIAGGLQTGFGMFGDYEAARDAERARMAENKRMAGGYELAGQIAGGLTGGAGLLKSGLTATRLAPRGFAGQAAGVTADGAVLGGVNAKGTDADVATGAAFGAGAGLVGSAVGSGLTKGVSKILGRNNPKPNIPSMDELKATKEAAYRQADNAGVIYSPQATNRIRDDLTQEFAQFGYHPELQPGAKTALGEVDRLAGQNVTFKGMETARRIAGNAYQPGNKPNNALTSMVRSKIDDLVTNPQRGDVIAGDSAVAGEAVSKARDMHSRISKMEMVDDLLEKAGLRAGSTGSGGNVENASRQNLRRMLDNPKLKRGLSGDEQQAVREAVLGTPGQNAMRLAGKLSPQGNGLMAAMGLGATAYNPAMAAIPIAGYVAKKGAERSTQNSIKRLRDLIAAGGDAKALAPVKNNAQKAIERRKQEIIHALIGAGAVTTGN